MTASDPIARPTRTGALVWTTLTCAALLSGARAWPQEPAHNIGYGAPLADGGRGVPLHPDPRVELALKITQPFTVVGLGDLLQFQPFATRDDPDVQFLLSLIRTADVATGDFENEIHDFDNFGHVGLNLATKEVADDWALMGIDMVSRANNKSQRAPGVWEDLRQVERVGIVHAGVAHSLPEARMGRYHNTPKGLVGFVGVYSEGGTDTCCAGGRIVYVTEPQRAQLQAIKAAILARRNEIEVPIPEPRADAPGTVSVFGVTFKVGQKPAEGTAQAAADAAANAASDATAARRGHPEGGERGPLDAFTNTLHVTLYHGVTAEQMAQLRAIAGDSGTGADLAAFGTRFRVMDRPGEHSFDMDAQDRKEILTQIRTAKQAADILVTNLHWHQNRYDFQAYSYDHFPADFEIEFAHQAIEQGVDVFVAQGVHTLKGVEIYRGKPIFYGTSNFIFQSAIMPRPGGKLPPSPGPAAAVAPGGPGAADFPGIPGEAADSPGDAIVGEHETQGFWQLKANLESILTYSHFEHGRLTEVRIYPVDLGQTPRVGTQVGMPKRPTPAVAQKILNEVIEYSKPFGTRITVKDGVGIIHIAER